MAKRPISLATKKNLTAAAPNEKILPVKKTSVGTYTKLRTLPSHEIIIFHSFSK